MEFKNDILICKLNKLPKLLGKSNYKDYLVVIAKSHPALTSNKKPTKILDPYLWYPVKDEIIPDTFADYFRKKLGIYDDKQAKRIVDQFNLRLEINHIIPLRLKD